MNLVQRTRQLGETEEPVLEQPHSDRNFQEPDEREEGARENEQRAAPNVERRERIKWPKSKVGRLRKRRGRYTRTRAHWWRRQENQCYGHNHIQNWQREIWRDRPVKI